MSFLSTWRCLTRLRVVSCLITSCRDDVLGLSDLTIVVWGLQRPALHASCTRHRDCPVCTGMLQTELSAHGLSYCFRDHGAGSCEASRVDSHKWVGSSTYFTISEEIVPLLIENRDDIYPLLFLYDQLCRGVCRPHGVDTHKVPLLEAEAGQPVPSMAVHARVTKAGVHAVPLLTLTHTWILGTPRYPGHGHGYKIPDREHGGSEGGKDRRTRPCAHRHTHTHTEAHTHTHTHSLLLTDMHIQAPRPTRTHKHWDLGAWNPVCGTG
jgi:hypothetical protein